MDPPFVSFQRQVRSADGAVSDDMAPCPKAILLKEEGCIGGLFAPPPSTFMAVGAGIVVGDTPQVFAGVRLQPVISQMNANDSCVFVFPFFCLCDLSETLFQRMEGSFQVDWKSLRQSILLGSSC